MGIMKRVLRIICLVPCLLLAVTVVVVDGFFMRQRIFGD